MPSLCDAVSCVCNGAADIEAWELEEFLEDILNAEFNLVRDAANDGSDVALVSA